MRPQFEELAAGGLLERSRKAGVALWNLASTGRRRTAALRKVGLVPTLPESPQHRKWREAHDQATEQIVAYRTRLRETLDEAVRMLGRDDGDSEAWYVIEGSLYKDCTRLASATYCLREWGEPDDERADIDPEAKRRPGRREFHYWAL